MPVLLLAFIVYSALMLLLHVALSAGIIANFLREGRGEGAEIAEHLCVEVVVAVRDEESCLPRLLDSLRGQTAADCLFLFVDDRSTDSTPRILDDFCASLGARARVVHASQEPHGLTGKQAALDLAFERARGDLLLFTDGDCWVPPGWAEEMRRHFLRDDRVGAVLGRIELPEGASFLARFQAFEQPLLNQYNFGSAGLGMPTGCFGNNLAVRAEALRSLGGFRSLGYSVTEDALLLNALCRAGRWKVRVCASDRAAVTTVAKTGWRDFVQQHTRWNAGALFSSDLLTRISYILVVLIYLVGSILVMPLGILDWRVPLVSLTTFLSIGLLAALAGLSPGTRKARYYGRFLFFLVFFVFFYGFITLRTFARRPFDWKGVSLPAAVKKGR
jgi:cellulose synthase/poly-beta-1,6-N-acetylglucosamine synthase-like glycosyltransferase